MFYLKKKEVRAQIIIKENNDYILNNIKLMKMRIKIKMKILTIMKIKVNNLHFVMMCVK